MKKAARKKANQEAEKAELAQMLLPMAAMVVTLRRGLRDFVVESGMQVLATLLEDERGSVCGPRYKHDAGRLATRTGHVKGELVLGGRRVQVRRPRARGGDGKEVHLPSWVQFAAEDPLQERAVEEMLIGVSTRKYKRALEPVPVEVKERGTSKSAVSRRFVSATSAAVESWMKRDLSKVDLAAILIDGLAFTDHVILIALGIDADGGKHVLGLHEGATENATACGALLDDLIERGVRTDYSLFFGLDGAKALHKAVTDRFGEYAVIQRCQVHKKRNVRDHLPEYMRPSVSAMMAQAYATRNAGQATKLLENLARTLDKEHPGAASSVREGLAETLTVLRLGLPQLLARALATTNAIENLNSTARHITRNVKHWRDGDMIVRWTCAAMREAESRFRRVNGAKGGMPVLLIALRKNDAKIENKNDVKPDNKLDRKSAIG